MGPDDLLWQTTDSTVNLCREDGPFILTLYLHKEKSINHKLYRHVPRNQSISHVDGVWLRIILILDPFYSILRPSLCRESSYTGQLYIFLELPLFHIELWISLVHWKLEIVNILNSSYYKILRKPSYFLNGSVSTIGYLSLVLSPNRQTTIFRNNVMV